MSFRIHALQADRFAPYFSMSDEELARHRALRVRADANPGFPCRVSLADAEIGETLVLLNFEHLPTASPFRAAHAIYVREHARQAELDAGEIPQQILSRPISIRAFDERQLLVGAELAQGEQLGGAIETLLAEPEVAFVHLHFARAGCYAARAERC